MLSEPIISFRNVWKKYSRQQVLNNSLREELVSLFTGRKSREDLDEGEFWALQGINFDIKQGECIGLYGPNGSGKSTILKLISNVTYPTRGIIDVRGRVAPLIELGAGMHLDLTGIENIYMNGTILGVSIRELRSKVDEIIDFSGLNDFINVPVKKYSSGMYLRLAFSIAVHSAADIFLFDEVLAVGDEEFKEKCRHKISDIMVSDKIVLIVSHDKEDMQRYCDRILSITHGIMQ
ncbi:hypothetical protein GURASL_20650 [Geotalea uraniireducens]|uniref:ABC transporter domain-containing protein n=1 Tax=Geotalea uraniireducens TaxID=351604 RepID=A0ABN6VUI0_9BACT|nr:ABC transporter ATP-binding protein [Geotalea uraniireducens]BDV43142.1 hypothetical protein GURASL_20650 [Geotalea uraniireducens]